MPPDRVGDARPICGECGAPVLLCKGEMPEVGDGIICASTGHDAWVAAAGTRTAQEEEADRA